MPVANHEGARIRFASSFTPQGGGDVISGLNYNQNPLWTNTPHDNVVGVDIPDIAYQSASVTSRTNNQPVAAIGYRGIAAITDLIGSVDLTLEGILCWNVAASGLGADNSTPGYRPENLGINKKGLLDTDLDGFSAEWGMVLLETKGEDLTDEGKLACLYGLFLTSITYTFTANQSVTTNWNYVGYNCIWERASADLEDHVIDGTGTNFVPVSSKDVDIEVVFPTDLGLTISNIQNATFTGTLNRDEVYAVGSLAPIDRPLRRPFEVAVNFEVLADTAKLLNTFTPIYKWNNEADASNPNKIQVYAYRKNNAGVRTAKICGAPYQRPVDGSLRVSVGANSNAQMNTTGWILEV